MKSAVAFVLTICLVAATLPVAAQSIVGPPDAFAQAVARETARLAFVGTESAPELSQAPGKAPADPQWTRVRNVTPGSELNVQTRSLRSATRYFVWAGEGDLTVLDLNDSDLTGHVKYALQRLASTKPGALIGARTGAAVTYGDVRVTASGVFLDKDKVAELAAVLETVKREDVVQLKVVPSGHATRNGALVGLLGGLALAGAAALSCPGNKCSEDFGSQGRVFTLFSVIFGGLGAGIGAGAGALVGAFEDSPVVYRAPVAVP